MGGSSPSPPIENLCGSEGGSLLVDEFSNALFQDVLQRRSAFPQNVLPVPSSRTLHSAPSGELSDAKVRNFHTLSYAISDRRAVAVKQEGGIVESNTHLHAQCCYNWQLEDRWSQPRQPSLSVGIPGTSSKRRNKVRGGNANQSICLLRL